jgi:hypothetical protein
VDSNGQSLAYVYGHADLRAAQIAKGLTLDEARRIATTVLSEPPLALDLYSRLHALGALFSSRIPLHAMFLAGGFRLRGRKKASLWLANGI